MGKNCTSSQEIRSTKGLISDRSAFWLAGPSHIASRGPCLNLLRCGPLKKQCNPPPRGAKCRSALGTVAQQPFDLTSPR